MKKSKILLTVIGYFAITAAFCQNDGPVQNDNTKKRKLKVVDAAFQVGMSLHESPVVSYLDFQKLNPESVLLDANFDGYTSSSGFTGFVSPAFSANLGINFLDKEKTDYKSNTQLRIGISFSELNLSSTLHKSESNRFDTLTSSQTGQVVYSDSVKDSYYNMNYKSQQLRIDVSIIYRTDPAARWSLYGGLGIEAGQSVMAYSNITYSESSKTETQSNSGIYSNYSNYSSTYTTERLNNKNSYGYAAYIPMGIDFRVGNKRAFFKQLHFYYEARPFINYTNIPELGNTSSVGLKSGLGIRVTI